MLPPVGSVPLGELGSRAMSIYRGTRNVDEEAARRVVGALREDYDRAGRLPIGAEERTAAASAGTPTALVDYGGERTKARLRQHHRRPERGPCAPARGFDGILELVIAPAQHFQPSRAAGRHAAFRSPRRRRRSEG
jgi:hypothetical protein